MVIYWAGELAVPPCLDPTGPSAERDEVPRKMDVAVGATVRGESLAITASEPLPVWKPLITPGQIVTVVALIMSESYH